RALRRGGVLGAPLGAGPRAPASRRSSRRWGRPSPVGSRALLQALVVRRAFVRRPAAVRRSCGRFHWGLRPLLGQAWRQVDGARRARARLLTTLQFIDYAPSPRRPLSGSPG